jgi:hypothetical protein
VIPAETSRRDLESFRLTESFHLRRGELSASSRRVIA